MSLALTDLQNITWLELNLSGNKLGDAGVKPLSTALSGMQQLKRSRRALALAVTTQVRRYRKYGNLNLAVHALAVHVWLFTVPSPLYSVQKCLRHSI